MAIRIGRALPAALAGLSLVLATACSPTGKSDAYPSADTVELVVPFAAGGATDSFARLVAAYVQENSDIRIQVVNKEGAGGITGTSEVARAKNDGYTLITTAASSTMLNFAANQAAPYQPDDLTFLARVSLSPLVLIVRADSPYQTANELLDAVAANPSEFSIGTTSLSGPSTFGVGKLLDARGIDPDAPKLVVLNSGATTVTSVAGGQVDFAAQLAPEVRQLLAGGKVRGLAVSSDTPIESIPGVPSATEAGVPAFNDASVSGIAGPEGLPEPVVSFWQDILRKATEDEAFQTKLQEIGSVPAFLPGSEYQQWNTEQIANARKVAEALGITQ